MSGCGCGGTGQSPSGCGCGGAPLGVGAAHGGTFARPTFFAGQLLTEEDLETLGGYMIDKNRLHNRYLVGAGVVCGLDVGCATLGSGTVRVRSGYALDCCGNDIVVSCDELVDVNKLIADLPHIGGWVTPCPDPKADPKNGSRAGELARRYELLIEYAETATELVAPFAVDEDVARACEPSRIREGYRFSIRCAPDDRRRRPPTLTDALTACAELTVGADSRLSRLNEVIGQVDKLARAPRQDAPPPPADPNDVVAAVTRLHDAPSLDRALDVAAIATRLAIAGFDDAATDTFKAVTVALEIIKANTATAADQLSPVASAVLGALADRVSSLINRLGGKLEPSPADYMLANGVAVSENLRETARSIVAIERDWALSQLEGRLLSHCRATAELNRLTVPSDDDAALLSAAKAVVAAVQQIVVECMCGAVNPPCPSCEDSAVTLAVITVEGCEVVEVCSSVRRHALTGSALRYWLPLEILYDQIEDMCCGDRDTKSFERFMGGEHGLLFRLSAEVQRMQTRLGLLEVGKKGP